MFSKVNGTQIFLLHRDLYHFTQGTLTIAAYFGKLKRLWDELAAIDDLVLICVEGNALLESYKEKQKLIPFLLGLNESYISVRSHLLMQQPLSTLCMSYSILLQYERQKSIDDPIIDDLVNNFNAFFSPSVGNDKNKSSGGNSVNFRGKIDKIWLVMQLLR